MSTQSLAEAKLLSLDGGGVRGLSSLLILENLMHRISPEAELLPCNIFDMIGGTSTGGIIAIMLGRLQMSVKDCIASYHDLSREIFDGPRQPKAWKMSKNILGMTRDAEIRSRRLEDAICRIVIKYLPATEKASITESGELDPRTVPLMKGGGAGAKGHVFVVAAQQSNGRPTVLRTYPVPHEPSRDFTIVEACLATSAAPFIFSPLKKGPKGGEECFIDGGLGSNNPVSIVLQECRSLWPVREIKCLVSVGTGGRVPREVKNNLVSVVKKVAEMITDASKQAGEFEVNIRLTEPKVYAAYFRLDVGEAMNGVGLDEWRMLGAISQRTRTWISSQHDPIERCAVRMGCRNRSYEYISYQNMELGRYPPTMTKSLPELTIEIKPTISDFSDELEVTDPEDFSKLKISLWRTVRFPEDGRVFDLPAGLGKFPLIDAEPFKDKLRQDGMGDADLIIPMYDREAMYIEFQLGKFDFAGPQRPFAIRPYVGGINAISGKSLQSNADSKSVPGSSSVGPVRTRVGERAVNEDMSAPPGQEQDYIVTDISIHDVGVIPQWLDGIATAPGRVKQFVCVPFGSGESVESQKRGKDEFGGMQLEIIPSLPLCRLRPPPTKEICIYLQNMNGRKESFWIDCRALVWDLLYKVDARFNSGLAKHLDFHRLVYEGQFMEPLATLDYYGITHESVVSHILKLRGGGKQEKPPKRMAIGAGGAISQNLKRDRQPPNIWDYSRAKLINIQIVNSLAFEEVSGILAPMTPIDFRMYQELGVPFFRYYTEDAEAISGDFKSVQSVGSIASSTVAGGEEKQAEGFWGGGPDTCSKCNENAPYRLFRPCGHNLCRSCYETMTIEERVINGVSTLVSSCPVPGCGNNVDRAVAWPYSSEEISKEQLYSPLPIRARNGDAGIRAFRSAAPPAKELGYRRSQNH
ncbi:hypothetical protein V500_01509 [Pseudogymnoascus sp. VKM F-4518 (FW-2643)]|nr:hypothetical protein V500_01509 [Pseudogymnoascus sp. VKM F-4518 (FW-2643)]